MSTANDDFWSRYGDEVEPGLDVSTASDKQFDLLYSDSSQSAESEQLHQSWEDFLIDRRLEGIDVNDRLALWEKFIVALRKRLDDPNPKWNGSWDTFYKSSSRES